MSTKVNVIGNGATVKLPTAGATYAGNLGIPNLQPSLGGGGYSANLGAINGGVTKEGVIVGGATGNLEKFPTIGGGTVRQPSTGTLPSATLPTAGSIIKSGNSFADQLRQLTQGLFKTTNSPAASALNNPAAVSPANNVAHGSGEQAQSPETAAAEQAEAAAPMSYEEYIEAAKQGYQKQLDAAKKEAEQTKERAMVDAQSSYMQNMAGYGVNAENMAQMGLQGGGYSDYINAQAYAQKRGDVQQANALEAAQKQDAENTYQGYINQLNEQLANKALEDQRIEEQRKYDEEQAAQSKKDDMYASLWEGVLDPNSGYTAEAIDELGREYGLSADQLTSLKNILAATQSKSAADKSSALLESALSDIKTNGTMLSNDYLNSLKELGMSDEDYAKAQNAMQKRFYNDFLSAINSASASGTPFDKSEIEAAYKAGNLSAQQYGELMSAYAKNVVDTATSSDDVKNIEASIDNVEQLYQSGSITQETYQSVYEKYYQSGVGGITDPTRYKEYKSDLDKALADGKLSQSGYNSITKSMKDQEKTIFKTSKKSGGISSGNTVTIKFAAGDGTFYNNDTTITFAPVGASNWRLNDNSSIVQEAGTGQAFLKGGKVYIKASNGYLYRISDGYSRYGTLKDYLSGTIYDLG